MEGLDRWHAAGCRGGVEVTWVRIDDTFPEHPKVVGLSAVAFRLHVAAICYASRNLTDGFIPLGAVRTLPGGTPNRAKELADAGLWITDGPGWQLHDYLDYNRSRGDVEAERDTAKDRMKRVRNGKRSPNVRANKERSS